MNGYNFSDASDIRLGSSTITALYYGSTLIWPTTPPPTPTDWSTEYLQVEALEPLNLTTNMPTTKTFEDILNVQYSVDKVNWYAWNEDISISMNTGDIVYFKGSYIFQGTSISGMTISSTSDYRNALCQSTGNIRVQGNVMSLIYDSNFINQTSLAGYYYCFFKLFFAPSGISSYLTDASNLILPATTLEEGCYRWFFGGCTQLTTTPELPATTLAYRCYHNMFARCTSLTTAPELPATILVDSCYYLMFTNCPSLNYVKCLATDISATHCTFGWLVSVATTGTFVKDANTTWPTNSGGQFDPGIPSGWTVQNI